MSDSQGSSFGVKGLLSAIVILAVIGFKVWNRVPHDREITSEQITIAGDQCYQFEFHLNRASKINVNISQTGNTPYHLVMLDKAANGSFEKLLKNNLGSLDKINFIVSESVKGDKQFPEKELQKGEYFIYLESQDESALKCQFDVSAYY